MMLGHYHLRSWQVKLTIETEVGTNPEADIRLAVQFLQQYRTK